MLFPVYIRIRLLYTIILSFPERHDLLYVERPLEIVAFEGSQHRSKPHGLQADFASAGIAQIPACFSVKGYRTVLRPF